MDPVSSIADAIAAALNMVEKALPGSEERLKRIQLREEGIRARARTSAEREAKKQFDISLRKLEKALKVARKHGIDTTDIQADIQKLLEAQY